MNRIGIVEGFFGPTWTKEARCSYPSFLKETGSQFYLYAPKRDGNLRKKWRDNWPSGYLEGLGELRDIFQAESIEFGIGLSPIGLGVHPSKQDVKLLESKFKSLRDLNLDCLGLFFDDMPVNDHLLKTQALIVNKALEYFPKGLLFCPSFYSYDPILDKVFGSRPLGYVEGLKDAIPSEVDICWTGPKVISEEISREHLLEVENLLGRKPFIWENLYANDGPKNCKFLKLKYFQGRDQSLIDSTAGVALNLMNQPYLSQVLYLSSLYVLRGECQAKEAFEKSCFKLLSAPTADFLCEHRLIFLEQGLDKLDVKARNELLDRLNHFKDGAASEVAAWLRGEYLVGPECLTD